MTHRFVRFFQFFQTQFIFTDLEAFLQESGEHRRIPPTEGSHGVIQRQLVQNLTLLCRQRGYKSYTKIINPEPDTRNSGKNAPPSISDAVSPPYFDFGGTKIVLSLRAIFSEMRARRSRL